MTTMYFGTNGFPIPNDYLFYFGTCLRTGSLAGMLGVALFQMFLSRGTYRKAFCTTLILKLVASLFDLFIINRENIKLGIPDKVAFILGDASRFYHFREM
jgi:hypothetical protein